MLATCMRRARLPLQIRFLDTSFYNAGGSTHTHASVPIGSPKVGDVLVVVAGNGATGGTNFTSCTIGGEAATLAGQNSGSNVRSVQYYLVVTSGSSLIGHAVADIAFTFGSGAVRSQLGLYRLSGQRSNTPYSSHFPSGGGSGGNRTATLDIPAGGLAIGFAYGGEPTGTWTGVDVTDFSGVEISSGASGATKRSKVILSSHDMTNDSCRVVSAVAWR